MRTRRTAVVALTAVVLLGGCAAPRTPQEASAAAEAPMKLWVVTEDHQLLGLDAAQPQRIAQRLALQGLASGEAVVGIDFRVARGVLYALTDAARLYTVDTSTGRMQPVAPGTAVPPFGQSLRGRAVGMDFNPTVDRVRVVTDNGDNLRLHPDTNALVDFDPQVPGVQPDPALRFDPQDVHAGKQPQVVGAAYTYNKQDDKLTTNFALDRLTGSLLTQGTREGVQPLVHPNLGRLFTVGPLGVGAFTDASFDIADVDNRAVAALRMASSGRTVLARIDLGSGRARVLGLLGDGAPLRGLAIEP